MNQNVSSEGLAAKRCLPCEGGVGRLSPTQAETLLAGAPEWRLTTGGDRVRRDWKAKNFVAGMAFLNAVAEVAEAEAHHPDVHIEGYRHVWIEIWTHAVGGLSENDFILAAKIDRLAFDAKPWPTA